jgi:hypothetical protein
MEKQKKNIPMIIISKKRFFDIYYGENFTYKQARDYIRNTTILDNDEEIQTLLGELLENENKD